MNAFVATEFVLNKARNSAYHTAANGWPEHRRYAAAFGFVDGTLELDSSPEPLRGARVSAQGRAAARCRQRTLKP